MPKQKHDTSIDAVVIERFQKGYGSFVDEAFLPESTGCHPVWRIFNESNVICPDCQAKLCPIYQGWLTEETKNYWENPSAGSGVTAEPLVKKPRKPVVKHEQMEFEL